MPKNTISEYHNARQAVADLRARLEGLKAKHGELAGRLQTINAALQDAKTRRSAALSALDESALKAIRAEALEVESERAETADLIEAVDSATSSITRELQTAEASAASARRAAWRAIAQALAENPPSGFVLHLERLRAAQNATGGRFGAIQILGFGSLENSHGIPGPEQKAALAALTADLAKEFDLEQ